MSYQVRPATDADLGRIVAIVNAQAPHPTTVEALVAMDRRHEPGQPLHRAVAINSQGEVLGHLVVFTHSAMHPGAFHAQVMVDPRHQRAGVGTALDRYLEEWVRGQGGNRIEGSVKESNGEAQAWATNRGYATTAHVYMSRLGLRDWDPSPHLDAMTRAIAQGFRFTTVAAEGGMAVLDRLYSVMVPIHNDIPGWEGRPIPSLATWRSWVENDETWNNMGIILAIHGDTWAAVTKVDLRDGGQWAYNDFTGVLPGFRGMGLSRAIKVAALNWAKSQGAAYIKTENHSLNKPMIATNIRLGYVPEPGKFGLVRSLD